MLTREGFNVDFCQSFNCDFLIEKPRGHECTFYRERLKELDSCKIYENTKTYKKASERYEE